MKIAFIVPHFYPDMAGGIEWYAYHMTRELAARGQEIHVFTQQTKQAPQEEDELDMVKIHRLRSRGAFYRVKFWSGLKDALARHPVDVIISFDYVLSSTWDALKFGASHHTPVAIILYCIQSHKKPRPFFKQIPMAFFDRYLAKRYLRQADLIMMRTEYTRNWLQQQNIDEHKITLAPAGLTDEELKIGDGNKFRRKFKLTDGPIVLYLGRLRRQKGIFHLLSAFHDIRENVPQAQLVYVGPDDKKYDGLEYTPELKMQITSEGHHDVHILGGLYGQDKVNALRAANVLALPSSYESFGQVLLQAMAQETPVVATKTGGMPYVCQHGLEGYLIEYGDQVNLSERIITILQDEKLAKQMGSCGRAKAKRYNYPELAQKLMIKLKTIIEKKDFTYK